MKGSDIAFAAADQYFSGYAYSCRFCMRNIPKSLRLLD